MRVLLVTGVAAALLAAAAAEAHHSFAAEFNANDPVDLRGKIAQVKLMNPHSWIYIDVPQPDGSVVQWGIEGGSPNTLFRKGFTKASLPVGTTIVVAGFRARDKSNSAVGVSVTFTDGKKLFLGGTAPGAEGAP
jgi:hypothetical protein